MKKIVGIILMLVVITTIVTANAIGYDEARQTLDFYCKGNPNLEKYLNEVAENDVYYLCGFIDVHGFDTRAGTSLEGNFTIKDFEKEYKNALEKEYNQKFDVVVTKDGNMFGYDIYRITIASSIDLVDWIDGRQNIVDALVMFIL